LERFKNPKNVGKLEDHNGRGKAGDVECSDAIGLFIRFSEDKVDNAKFNVFGCPGAISTTDVLI